MICFLHVYIIILIENMGISNGDWLWRIPGTIYLESNDSSRNQRKGQTSRKAETVDDIWEVILLVMVKKSSAKLEAIYRRAMIWPIIADLPP